MNRIPEGRFTAGSSAGERQRLAQVHGFHPSLLADELGASSISMATFFIDAYPVTNGEYAVFLQETGHDEPVGWREYATVDRANHPVVGVSGRDADAYARWAGKRLPTPEEWEAAFQGVAEQPGRPLPAGDWTPQTDARSADRGPASRHGVRGFGQVSEWTSATTPHHRATFQLLKGPSWISAEAWSLRVQAAFWATSGWRSAFTGFRCAADTDVGPVPSTALSRKPVAGRRPGEDRPGSPPASPSLTHNGKRGVTIAFCGLRGSIRLFCPETVSVDGETIVQYFTDPAIESFTVPGVPGPRVHYAVREEGIEMEASFEMGDETCDLDYLFRYPLGASRSLMASTCVNLSGTFGLYDFEGTRSYIWPGRGEWIPVRSLSRVREKCTRWIAQPLPSELPRDCAAMLAAVVSRDGQSVFGYGRRASGGSLSFAHNFCFTCFHINPTIAVTAGGSGTSKARIYYVRGGLEDLRTRFVRDFGIEVG